MEYRIEHLDFDLKFIGKGEIVKTSRAFKTIPTLWSSAKKDGFLQQLIDLSWEEPKCTLEGLLGVCGKEVAIMDTEFTYFMGVRYDGEISNEMDTFSIIHNTWAVFPGISNAWKQLYTEWLPNSEYQLANVPCIECYYPPKHKPRNELWVPVSYK